MARPTSNLRLFVAIYPPLEFVAAMRSATIDAANREHWPAHRMTPDEQVHMTVQFIGDTPAKDLEETIESMHRAAAGLRAFTLTPQRLITLPERGPARLVAAQTSEHATLTELHRRLVIRLAGKVQKREAERFRPHFTLCRFRSPARGVSADQMLTLPAFEVNRIALMRSTLSSTGAIHHEVAACALG